MWSMPQSSFSVFIFLMLSSGQITHQWGCRYPSGIYKGMCVQCPEDTLHEEYWSNDICTEKCSQTNPLILGSSCITRCPRGYTEHRNRNIRYCKNGTLPVDEPCPINRCKNPLGVCYKLRCLKSCPAFTIQYDDNCVIECPPNKPYINDNLCVEMCPINSPFVENKICVSSCSKTYFKSNMSCVHNCSEKEYVDGNNCVRNCTNGYAFQMRGTRLCVDFCPEDTVSVNKTCQISCSEQLNFYHNGTCVKKCPSSSKFVLSSLTRFETTFFKCVQECPQFSNLYNICVQRCSGYEYVRGKSCVENCSEDYIFETKDFRHCVDSCPDETVTVNKSCHTSCARDYPFYLNGTCVKQCPSPSKYILSSLTVFGKTLRKCVRECPKYSSMWNFYCVDVCKSYEVLYKNECKITCPPSDPYRVGYDAFILNRFTFNTTYIITRPINAFSVCVSHCEQSYVVDEDQCQEDCFNSSRKMEFNQTCIEKCPSDYPMMLRIKSRFRCVENCPFVQYMNICRTYCGEHFRINNTCVDECPYENLFEFQQYQAGRSQLTEKVCQSNCSAFRIGNRCVDRCPQSKPYMNGMFCLEKCSDAGKFRTYYSFDCINSCPDAYYNGEICVSKCPRSAPFRVNSTCERNCPPNYPYKNVILTDVDSFNLYSGYYKCVDACPDGKFTLNDKCVKYCHEPKPYEQNNTCSENCPHELPYAVEYENLNVYPWATDYVKFFNKSSFKCSKSCKDNQFKVNTVCYNKCPKGKEYMNRCFEDCPPESKWTFENKCVPRCPLHTYSSVLTMSCVPSCPPDSFKDGTFCLKGCSDLRPLYVKTEKFKFPNHLFYFECFRSCPDSLVANTANECIEKYDCNDFVYDGKCLLACPKDTFEIEVKLLIGKRLSCSSLRPYYFTLIFLCPVLAFFLFVIFRMAFQRGKCETISYIQEDDPKINETLLLKKNLGKHLVRVFGKKKKVYALEMDSEKDNENEETAF